MVRRAELLFETFAGDEVIQHIKAAKYASPFKTMNAPPDATSRRIPPAKYFGGIAFGCNVFLCCHTDDDFTLSMAHILLDGSDVYSLDDEVVVYFCFPTLGVAVPMRPGDFLFKMSICGQNYVHLHVSQDRGSRTEQQFSTINTCATGARFEI
jgi:hypothetical protein